MIQGTSKGIPVQDKYALTFEEGAAYFGVGETALRRFVKEHPNEDFYFSVGVKTLIKRRKFEEVLDGIASL